MLTWSRVGGALLISASAAATGWLVTSDQFAIDESQIELSGLVYTDEAAVRAAAGFVPGSAPNMFRVRTREMERALEALPAVADAEVHVVLPGRLVMAVTERQPVMIVRRAGVDYLVDIDGVVLGEAATELPATGELPTVDDRRRTTALPLAVGGTLDPSDLAAMLQLAAVTPATLESDATSLRLSVDDTDGFVLAADLVGWRAVFGHYTATLRPPDMIARQVQCLRSLLAVGEDTITTIYLAPLDDRCGTVRPEIRTAHDAVAVALRLGQNVGGGRIWIEKPSSSRWTWARARSSRSSGR